MKAKKLVIGNWKMYVDSPKQAKELYRAVSAAVRKTRRASVVVCPPMPFVGLFANTVPSALRLGAQDVFWSTDPTWTGQASAYALRSAGVSHVIIGHSEVRSLGETSEAVALKAKLLIATGLTPVICIGEKQRDLRGGYLSMLEEQIRTSLAGISRQKAAKLVIAYEPLWAIGKTAAEAMLPEHIHETVLFIKKNLVSLYGRKTGTTIPILYGGSVEATNAAQIIKVGAVDGFLVGHASVDAKEFGTLLKNIDH